MFIRCFFRSVESMDPYGLTASCISASKPRALVCSHQVQVADQCLDSVCTMLNDQVKLTPLLQLVYCICTIVALSWSDARVRVCILWFVINTSLIILAILCTGRPIRFFESCGSTWSLTMLITTVGPLCFHQSQRHSPTYINDIRWPQVPDVAGHSLLPTGQHQADLWSVAQSTHQGSQTEKKHAQMSVHLLVMAQPQCLRSIYALK